ncbi:MAG: hypothetical protein DIZ80_15070 [endosymbiont of Galathealinum brachiosum]|uniref:Uncharacterized protein n=1 Tax=endosymbiont of Galathealinum brachiosum TaxID=2200906 RepID=A0A370DB41_9GAMM|nr:MAG: hypothetical protein DIZ80_15070 [endosymbiont of Galathealinum brachiosum]
MTQQDDSVKTQHEMIKQGGQIEKFAEAMAQFCKVEGWKKLNDEEGAPFKTLRHYIEAKPPYGAGYPGKTGMEKIEAYLSLSPVIKDYFQHCHANCLFEMAKEEGSSPNVVAKREWNDVKGASLARAIQENPEEIYLEKAAAYVEGKERVKAKPRKTSVASPVRLSATPGQPYALVKKIKESFDRDFIKSFLNGFNIESLDEMIELEKKFSLALVAFNKSKQTDGWGSNNVKCPDSLIKREPVMEKSSFIGDESEEKNILSLKDDEGKIVIVRFRGTGVGALSFDDKN